jgi:hypothetical protein
VARKRLAHPAKKDPELIDRERVGFFEGVRGVLLTGVERFDRRLAPRAEQAAIFASEILWPVWLQRGTEGEEVLRSWGVI